MRSTGNEVFVVYYRAAYLERDFRGGMPLEQLWGSLHRADSIREYFVVFSLHFYGERINSRIKSRPQLSRWQKFGIGTQKFARALPVLQLFWFATLLTAIFSRMNIFPNGDSRIKRYNFFARLFYYRHKTVAEGKSEIKRLQHAVNTLQMKYYLAAESEKLRGRYFFASAYLSPFVRHQHRSFPPLPSFLRLIFPPSRTYLRKKPVSRGALTLDYRGVNTGNGSRYPNQYFRMPFLKIDPSPQTLPISPFRA